MPALKNTRHEAFAQAVALGMPASQAYADCVSGGKCSERTAEVEGSKLANSPELSLRIADLRKGISDTIEKKFRLTKEKWFERLDTIADKAENAGDFSAATSSLREIGKAAGWYEAEKVEHSGSVKITIGGDG